MSTDPKLRQEVYGDGDNVSGNAMEPGGWSLFPTMLTSPADCGRVSLFG